MGAIAIQELIKLVEKSSQRLPSILYAEASVHSVGGVSLFGTSELITKENVDNFYSDPQLVQSAVEQLSAEGFNVLESGRISITISASPEVYQRVFRTNIIAQERPVIKGGSYKTTATYFDTPDTDTSGLIDTSRSVLADVLEGVAINEPAYYFASAFAPNKPYWHLKVPEDVSRGLKAHLAHEQGFTGRGVKAVMIDSGWYSHPFFAHHGYRANVILASGANHPESDEIGHGTGESANIFAVAPNVDLTMVKAALLNTLGAFKTAVSLRPDIISCSWGSTEQYPPLSAFNRVLAAVIADAVRQGIIVIFSAGNGQWGLPAQHPDVIAAGGVYMHPDGTLEASDYASGFASNIYQGRNVPDVCGLVGKRPRAAYIMLPVQPGCLIDSIFGLPGVKHPDGDETEANDGWAAFSGTSAAAPQLAGICALMKQAYLELSPKQAREILQQTARDVTSGSCNLNTGGHLARPGFDLATGSGLADAFAAIVEAKQEGNRAVDKKQQQEDELYQGFRTNKREVVMDSILKSKLEGLLWEFDKKLQELMDQNPQMQKVELRISEGNFVPRSPMTKAAASLRKTLEDTKQDIKVRVSAAEGLLQLGRYQEAAIKFLTEEAILDIEKIIAKPGKDTEEEKSHLRERVMKALGKISSGLTSMGFIESTDNPALLNCPGGGEPRKCSDGKTWVCPGEHCPP